MRTCAILVLLGSLAQAQTAAPEQLFRDAVAAQQRGDDATAIRKYQELLKQRPDIMEVRANLGAALARAGRLDEAVEQYRAALAKSPQNSSLRLNLALAYYKKKNYAEAAAELEPLRTLAPNDARVATLLGDCYAQTGRDDKAVTILKPVAAAHPDDLGVAWLLGSALIRTGQRREGLALADRVATEGHSAEAYLLAGQTALKLNEFERARDDAEAALRLNAKLPGALTLKGMVLPYLGDNPGAIATLRLALAANPDDFDAHLNLGAVLHTERQLPEAREHLARALALQPESLMARYEMARLERSEGKLDASVADFEKVIKADPTWPQPRLELSALYYRTGRQADGEREKAAYEKLTAK
jgi:tetratricopeptide (TPR) repeat protein